MGDPCQRSLGRAMLSHVRVCFSRRQELICIRLNSLVIDNVLPQSCPTRNCEALLSQSRPKRGIGRFEAQKLADVAAALGVYPPWRVDTNKMLSFGCRA